jgi:hypothetical protein
VSTGYRSGETTNGWNLDANAAGEPTPASIGWRKE